MFSHFDRQHSSFKRPCLLMLISTADFFSVFTPCGWGILCLSPPPPCMKQTIYPAHKSMVIGMTWFEGILVICLSPKGRKYSSWKIVCYIISIYLLRQTKRAAGFTCARGCISWVLCLQMRAEPGVPLWQHTGCTWNYLFSNYVGAS